MPILKTLTVIVEYSTTIFNMVKIQEQIWNQFKLSKIFETANMMVQIKKSTRNNTSYTVLNNINIPICHETPYQE